MPTILVADDNEEMRETLERIYNFYKFDVITASNGQEAVELAEQKHPDLIILDAMMPVMDGFEACKILKAHSSTKHIPIVFLTANYTHPDDRVAGLELGADDYLLKPFNSKELVARSRAILKRNEILSLLKTENEQLADKNKKIKNELQDLLDQAKTIDIGSLIDPLTGLYSISFFEKRLKEEYRRARRYQKDLSLALVQINQLERINEIFGKPFANYVVMKLANSLLNKTRESDVLSFLPQNNFYIILPETDAQGSLLKAERIRVTLDSVEFMEDEILETLALPKQKISEFNKISFNLGVATITKEDMERLDEKKLLKYANEALQKSIASGKNRTVLYNAPKNPDAKR